MSEISLKKKWNYCKNLHKSVKIIINTHIKLNEHFLVKNIVKNPL